MSISVSIIDTRDHQLAHAALVHSLDVMSTVCSIDKIYWYSDQPLNLREIGIAARWIKIKPIESMPFDYNCVALELMPNVAGEDVNIIIQTDGYPCNHAAWTDEFLNYDYIGAVWPWENLQVGNGGFSLRSRRLMNALTQMDLAHWMSHPEDAVICLHLRKTLENEYGIRFAPPEIADRFSIEWNMDSSWFGRSFGFHGQHTGVQEKYPRLTNLTNMV